MYVLHCWISYIHVHWWLPFLCGGHEGATVVSALVINPDLVQVLLQFLHNFFLAGSRVEGLSKMLYYRFVIVNIVSSLEGNFFILAKKNT